MAVIPAVFAVFVATFRIQPPAMCVCAPRHWGRKYSDIGGQQSLNQALFHLDIVTAESV